MKHMHIDKEIKNSEVKGKSLIFLSSNSEHNGTQNITGALNLESLLDEAGLKQQLERDLKNNASLAANWGVVKSWKDTSRYDRSKLNGKDLYTAITGADGVLPWIKQRW